MSIKQCFVSRWASGRLVEADFKQLEVVALAILSGDKNLIADLLSGEDMHVRRAAELFGVPEHTVTGKQRQIAKAMNFQLQYGAGATSMAEKLGVPKSLAKTFIENYYNRYPTVLDWQNTNVSEVKKSRKSSERTTSSGVPAGEGILDSPTGRMYKFYEYDNQYGGFGSTSFSPTEIKNYPVQGFATGDIMALYRAMVYRWYVGNFDKHVKEVRLINTVHDSVMLDTMDVTVVQYVYRELKKIADQLPEKLTQLWGIDTRGLKFELEFKVGVRWSDMYVFTSEE